MRINQYLSRCGVGSRRKVEELIINGSISINGVKCTELATQVDPSKDKVMYLKKVVQLPQDHVYIMLNKPRNYVVSHDDELGRKTVFELIPDLGVRLVAVGRLDRDTEGLLLLTSDGDFANYMLHPRYKIPKTYIATVKGQLEQEQIDILRNGVDLETGKTLPAKVFIKSIHETHTIIRLVIYEGKKRQIREMLKAVGSEVVSLKRTQVGGIGIEKLPVGMWRFLKPDEVLTLLQKKNVKKIYNEDKS